MTEATNGENTPETNDTEATNAPEITDLVPAGQTSTWLSENGFDNEALTPDISGVELIKVEAEFLLPIATALYAYGFNYLQCQGAYDFGAG